MAEVADDVNSVKVGDHVVGVPLVPCHQCEDCRNGNYSLCKHYSFVGSRQQGAMAESVVVPYSNVYKIEKSIPMHLAALFEPSTVALHGILINNFHPAPDDHVVVIGAGTIALFTLQWCKILGAKHVTAVIRNKSRDGIVRKYGANDVVSSLDDDYLEFAMAITNGKGYAYVLDAAGTGDTIKASFRLAGNKAHVCLIGTPTSPMEFSVPEWELINRKEMRLTGSWMSYSSPWPGEEWKKTAECMADGKLKLDNDMLCAIIELPKVKEAFSLYESRVKKVSGRIMLKIG